MAKLDIHQLEEGWLRRFYDKVFCTLRSADAQSISMTLWSMATLRLRPPRGLMSALEESSERRFGTANGQSLAIMAWALVKLGHRPRETWCTRSALVCTHDRSLPPSSPLSVKTPLLPPPFRSLARALHELPTHRGLRLASQDLANSAWALSQCHPGCAPPGQPWADAHAAALLLAVKLEMEDALVGVGEAASKQGGPSESAHDILAKASSLPPGSPIFDWRERVTPTALSRGPVAASAAGKASGNITSTLLALGKMGTWPCPEALDPLLGLQLRLLPHAAPESIPGATAVLLFASQAQAQARARRSRAREAPGAMRPSHNFLPPSTPLLTPTPPTANPSSHVALEPLSAWLSSSSPSVPGVTSQWLYGGYEGRELQAALLLASARQMHLIPPRGLVQLAWSLTRLGCKPNSKWMDR